MSENGFIYALINHSMDGLIKVGKTTRSPEERAKELSSHTGVPTPYIVAYQKQVGDCSQAECHVHMLLEEKGYRVQDNRDFFRVSLSEVVDIFLDTEIVYPYNEYEENSANESDVIADEVDNYLAKGKILYLGLDGAEVDYVKARKYFKSASKLGSLEAYYYLGDIFQYGYGVQSNIKEAIEYYEEAAKHGHETSIKELARIFVDQGEPYIVPERKV